jgi:predicted GNAT family acetyltransferase
MSRGEAVRDNVQAQRFELQTEAGTAYITYRVTGGVVSLDHTEVPEALAGRGIGSALVKGTLDLVGSRKQKIVANCSFVAKYIERHPDYGELLAE